jgi:flagellar biosynthesis protein FlhB
MADFLKQYILWADSRHAGRFAFDLQLFAAEDEGRTEEPTEKKLREARERGQVAKTMELPQAAVVIAGVGAVLLLGTFIYEILVRITRYYLTHFSRMRMTTSNLGLDFMAVLWESAKILLPIFAASIVAAVLANVVQVGFQVSTHPLKFDWSKLKFDPATVLKRLFFSKQVAMNLVKSLVKVAAIGFISYLIIANDFEDIMRTPDISLASALQVMCFSAFKLIVWSAVVLLALSIPDYFFQRQEFMESLKMTKQEMKEELKETMGDPYMRARLREMQREIVMKNMIREVPKADVVVTNPTHYSVALKYDKDAMEAPTVLAKGVDSMALRIREIAREHGVPMIENRPLAQEMYRRLEVGDIIPEDLFYAVSLIYAELFKKKQFKAAI